MILVKGIPKKEYMKIWRENNKEHINKYRQRYFQLHKERLLELKKEYRHKIGKSKRYNVQLSTEEKKQRKKAYKKRLKRGGKLTPKTIQLVYEDNIKRFGTLTCYLCLIPIEFGKDSLEHKTPLSRGGTNEYNNLAIACRICNSKKHILTEQEWEEREDG